MSCVKRITIIDKVQITGSLGTVRWFVPYNQYCFEEIIDAYTECDGCVRTKYARNNYYRVLIEGVSPALDETFDVPDTAAAMQMYDQPSWHQNWRERIERLTEQPADHIKTYKELTGIDLAAGNTVVHNGYDIWKKAQKTQEDSSTGIGTDTTK